MSRRLLLIGCLAAVLVSAGGCGASAGTLAQLRERLLRPATSVQRGRRFLLEVSPIHGSYARLEIMTARSRVVRRVANVSFYAQATVSPNGELVAWTLDPLVAWSPEGAYGVAVARTDGSARLRLPRLGPFAWSPDSTAILARDRKGGLEIVSLATGEEREIVHAQRFLDLTPLAWTRSHRIVYVETPRHGGGDNRLVIADESGASLRTIDGGANQDLPTVAASPNGEWINVVPFYDYIGEYNMSQFESFNVVTGKATRVRDFKYAYNPVWSPDSSRLLTGSFPGPLAVISPSENVVATIREHSLKPVAWTRDAIYLFGPVRGGTIHDVLAIPRGQSTARVLFRLPRQEILSVQPLTPG
jgi:hypothetical protein